MNLRNKIVNTVAAAAMLLGMTGGIALADDSDSGTAELNVLCAPAATVGVSMGDAFEVDLNSGPGPYNSTVSDLITITLNLSCNWNPFWVVKTNITDFSYAPTNPNPLLPGQAATFDGGKLKMTGGSQVSTTVPNTLFTSPPNVVGTVTPRSLFLGDVAMYPDLFIIFPIPAPGITVAHWGGLLTNLPSNLAAGTYQADLDVILLVP